MTSNANPEYVLAAASGQRLGAQERSGAYIAKRAECLKRR